MLAKKNYLLTGTTGFIGSEVFCRLSKKDPSARFVLLCRRTPEREKTLFALRLKEHGLTDQWPKLEFLETDFFDSARLQQSLGELSKADAQWTVVHMAAIISTRQATLAEQKRLNVGVTADLLKWSQTQAQHFIYTSSVTAFGGARGSRIRTEDDFQNFPQISQKFSYFQTKREAHEFILANTKIATSLFCPSVVHGSLENFKDSRGHLKALKAGRLKWAPTGGLNFVGLDRVAGSIVEAAIAEPQKNQVKTRLVVDRNLDYLEYFKLYLTLAGMPEKAAKIRRLPSFLPRLALAITEMKALPVISTLAQAGLYLFFKSNFEQAVTEGVERQIERSFV